MADDDAVPNGTGRAPDARRSIGATSTRSAPSSRSRRNGPIIAATAFTRLRADDRVALVVEGTLDFTSAAAFARELHRLICDADEVAIVDLQGVTSLDSSALGELEDARTAARRAEVDLVLVALVPSNERRDDRPDLVRPRPTRRFDVSNRRVSFERSDRAEGRALTVKGEIDGAVGVEFGEELAALVAEARSPAFVDLSGVTAMDSMGVHALVDAARTGKRIGVPLVLLAPSRSCRRVLEASGAWELLEVVE